MTTKPRLKPRNDGSLLVVRKGLNPWSEVVARKFVQEHYGTLATFAARYHFSYWAVCNALRSNHFPKRMAGKVAEVRQTLGLPSQPSHRALISANSKQQEQRP